MAKAWTTSGYSLHVMAASFRALALSVTLLAARAAAAGPCEVAIEVTGDPALVATVRRLLAERDPAAATASCPVVHARLERRGAAIAVVRVTEVVEERIVTAPETAAAVIESWSRTDLEEPLLELDALAPLAAPSPADVAPPAARGPATLSSTVRPRPVMRSGGLQGFAALESSFADDQTRWTGAVVGVCVPLGRICASARARFAAVTDGPRMWSWAERQAEDVLFGGDVPVGLGRTRLTVGFGAGMGAVHTRSRADGESAGSETFGLRADTHAAWQVPISSWLAIDLSATIDLAQVVDAEVSRTPSIADEPWLLARLGAGLRVGGR